MNKQNIFDNLKALQTRAFSLSKQDKKDIENLSNDLKIDFVKRKNCPNCYADQIIRLLIEVKKSLIVIENLNCQYVVIGDKDVTIRGARINNNTITDELAEWLIKVYPYHSKYIKRK